MNDEPVIPAICRGCTMPCMPEDHPEMDGVLVCNRGYAWPRPAFVERNVEEESD